MPRKKILPSPTTPEDLGDNICFVIMPFGGLFDDYFLSLYKPAIEEAGLIPKRADDLFRPSTIIHDIWTYTRKARLILADLSGKNPNVFYELGLAHAIAKPAILITETIDDVPFDLRALRIIEYRKQNPFWGDTLQKAITCAIREVIASPLDSVLPAFLRVREADKGKPVSETEKVLLELRRDVDLLSRAVRSRSTTDLIDVISAEEAERMVRAYVQAGMPKSLIMRRVAARGVPYSFVENLISGITGDKQQQEPPSPSAQKEGG